jgi:hypothetical protein
VKIGLYRERVEAAQSDPRRRWAAIRDVLRQTEPPDILPDEECQRLCDGFAKYFTEKIQLIKAAIRSKLADFESIPLLFDTCHSGCLFDSAVFQGKTISGAVQNRFRHAAAQKEGAWP